jgi:hypothetical protein
LRSQINVKSMMVSVSIVSSSDGIAQSAYRTVYVIDLNGMFIKLEKGNRSIV